MFRATFMLAALFFILAVNAQEYKLEMLSNTIPTNLRGLCPVDDNTIWVSGNYGFFGKSTNGGKNWLWAKPKGYEPSDFRDVFAFDSMRAVLMGTTRPAIILRTADGGRNWTEVFRSDDTTVFIDALDFWNDAEGICIGDWTTTNGYTTPYMLITSDTGKTWQQKTYPPQKSDTLKQASFAASGTCLRAYTNSLGSTMFAIALGGDKHQLFLGEKNGVYRHTPDIPYETTSQSQGIFSLAADEANGLIWLVGGDYAINTTGYCVLWNTRTNKFIYPTNQVNGYRSCVELFAEDNNLMVIACGTNGADIAPADPRGLWEQISKVPLNTVIASRNGTGVFLAGPQGTIYKLVKK